MLVSAGQRAPRGAAPVRYLWPSWPPQRLLLILVAYHNDIYFFRQPRRVAAGPKSYAGRRNLPAETCWRHGGWHLSLATGPRSGPAATKESPMYLLPLLRRVLITTASILLVLVGVTAVH
jgi:hypothetical protein